MIVTAPDQDFFLISMDRICISYQIAKRSSRNFCPIRRYVIPVDVGAFPKT